MVLFIHTLVVCKSLWLWLKVGSVFQTQSIIGLGLRLEKKPKGLLSLLAFGPYCCQSGCLPQGMHVVSYHSTYVVIKGVIILELSVIITPKGSKRCPLNVYIRRFQCYFKVLNHYLVFGRALSHAIPHES